MASVDAIRDLSSLKDINSAVEIKKATIDDLESVSSLSHQLHKYMTDSPIFLILTEESENVKDLLLDTSSKALWIAFKDGRAVSYMTVGPAKKDVAFVIQDESIASIHAAFTDEKFRGQGIGKALLNKSIEWASSMGYEYCAVDFEPENIEGSRFWMKHFKPICYSLVRNVNIM